MSADAKPRELRQKGSCVFVAKHPGIAALRVQAPPVPCFLPIPGFHGVCALDILDGSVKAKAGRIDVLFANVGLGEFVPQGQITEEHFDKTFGVNVKGTLFTVEHPVI